MTDLERRRPDILRIATEHGAKNVRVFGSEARGEAGPTSDLDLLVLAVLTVSAPSPS